MLEELVLNHINLIYYILKEMNLDSKQDEYFDIGMIGLMKGIKTYKNGSKTKLSTYAYQCIKNEILMELRKQRTNIRRANYNNISLDDETYINNDSNPITLGEMIASDVNIENQLIEQEKIKWLYQKIEKLNKREQFILKHLFGLKNCERLTQQEIASILNISQGCVSRIKNRGIEKLRKEVNYE